MINFTFSALTLGFASAGTYVPRTRAVLASIWHEALPMLVYSQVLIWGQSCVALLTVGLIRLGNPDVSVFLGALITMGLETGRDVMSFSTREIAGEWADEVRLVWCRDVEVCGRLDWSGDRGQGVCVCVCCLWNFLTLCPSGGSSVFHLFGFYRNTTFVWSNLYEDKSTHPIPFFSFVLGYHPPYGLGLYRLAIKADERRTFVRVTVVPPVCWPFLCDTKSMGGCSTMVGYREPPRPDSSGANL